MTFDDYQKAAMSTAIFPDAGSDLTYPALGLAGEGGEVAGKVKKLIRDYQIYNGDQLSPEQKAALAAELGDVLWYIAVLAETLGTSVEEIAANNIQKLLSRKERGVIKGSGDTR